MIGEWLVDGSFSCCVDMSVWGCLLQVNSIKKNLWCCICVIDVKAVEGLVFVLCF